MRLFSVLLSKLESLGYVLSFADKTCQEVYVGVKLVVGPMFSQTYELFPLDSGNKLNAHLYEIS